MDPISHARIVKRTDLQTIGSQYGGWVVPASLLGPDSICYCVGCGEDISFDLGLIGNFKCHVFGFDPTPKAITYVKEKIKDHDEYRFLEVGLWDQKDTLKFYVPKNPHHVSHSLVNLQHTNDYISVNVDRLSNIMNDLGHKKLDLLKIDIEGAEYKVIESIIEDNLNITVLCVEYDESHHPIDSGYKRRIRSSVNSLLKHGYRLVCIQTMGNYIFTKIT